MSEFDELTYFVVDFENIPSGWSNQEKRDSRKRVNRSVGKHSDPVGHLNTIHRQDVPTKFDEEGVLTQTAGKAMYRCATDLSDAGLIAEIYEDIADELGKTIQAVILKVGVWVVGNQQDAADEIDTNPAKWGERV